MGGRNEQRRLNDRAAVCPYFRYHTQRNIVCEGPFELIETNVRIIFEDEGEKDRHYRLYCCGHWEVCEQAAKTAGKYSD